MFRVNHVSSIKSNFSVRFNFELTEWLSSNVSQEKKNEHKASESTEIKLYAQYPPIEKMDASLSTLSCCE